MTILIVGGMNDSGKSAEKLQNFFGVFLQFQIAVDRAVEERKSNGMGAVSEWNQGEGARDCERTDYIRLAKGERRNPFLFIMQLKL